MKTYLIAISLFGIAVITTAITPIFLAHYKNLITLINELLRKWKTQNQLIGKMPREPMEEWQ